MSELPADAKVMTFICTTSRENTKAFYGGTLGLKLASEDAVAVVYETDGKMLRITSLKDFKAQRFTVLGWAISDIAAAVKALTAKGVKFQIYDGMGQDALGIWSPPGDKTKVAWFTDLDGNILSLTQF